MAFCSNCGQKLVDGAKFCYECGTKVNDAMPSNGERRRIIYDGDIHKCPNCGEMIAPHRACPACGFYKGKEVVSKKSEE